MRFSIPTALLAGALTIAPALAQEGEGAEDEPQAAPQEETTEGEQTEDERAGYALGVYVGKDLAQSMKGIVDVDALVQGLRDAFSGEAEISDEEIREVLMQLQKRAQEQVQAAAEENLAAGKGWLEENAGREGVQVTESGLQYMVLEAGDGEQPKATDRVRVHYHGTRIDGTVFDSSVDRGEPAEFPLNRVIPGWTEGLQLMKVGAKWKFFIPSELAYGEQARGEIQANDVLIFEVELLDILGPPGGGGQGVPPRGPR